MRPSGFWRATQAVRRAVLCRELPCIDESTICVDCGKQALVYDHRDYNKPLDVEPVCQSCNIKRGPGIPWDRKKPIDLAAVHQRPVLRVIQVFGNQRHLANLTGVTQQAVSRWAKSGCIPAEHVLGIVKAANGELTPFDIRPDIYPQPDSREATA